MSTCPCGTKHVIKTCYRLLRNWSLVSGNVLTELRNLSYICHMQWASVSRSSHKQTRKGIDHIKYQKGRSTTTAAAESVWYSRSRMSIANMIPDLSRGYKLTRNCSNPSMLTLAQTINMKQNLQSWHIYILKDNQSTSVQHPTHVGIVIGTWLLLAWHDTRLTLHIKLSAMKCPEYLAQRLTVTLH